MTHISELSKYIESSTKGNAYFNMAITDFQPINICFVEFHFHRCRAAPGVQEVGTAGTGQTTFSWTKRDEKIIGHIMARAKKCCPKLKNWTYGYLTSDLNTLSNKY
jgi:hypothetical protein